MTSKEKLRNSCVYKTWISFLKISSCLWLPRAAPYGNNSRAKTYARILPHKINSLHSGKFLFQFSGEPPYSNAQGKRKTVLLTVRDHGVGVEFQIVCPASNFGTVSRNYKTLY